MPYCTDERLKSYLDANQLHREQMCLAVLAIDKRFSDVRPRHPHGGPDGGRDIEACYLSDYLAYGAIGFVNQANDSREQKRQIKIKFEADLKKAINAIPMPSAFIFFTNINLTVKEKDNFINSAKKKGIIYCDIFDRERLRISLDSTDGFSIRFQYLNIPLSIEEQSSFFARWGADIQSVISTGFNRVKNTLSRLLFLQEASSSLDCLMMVIELNKKYSGDEIGHFRAFCSLVLREPRHNIIEMIFGQSDRSHRMMKETEKDAIAKQESGIKYGISEGQWLEFLTEDESKRILSTGSSSSVGMDEIKFIRLRYSTSSFIRETPFLTLKDLDEASFIICINDSLSEKVTAIHLYANGYKLKEYHSFSIDKTHFDPDFSVLFLDDEIKDPWVRIRPPRSSLFSLDFFDETPKRLHISEQINDSLGSK